MACKDAKDFVKATELFEKSANSYLNSGNMDTAAQIIDRAAKMMEQTSPTKAAEVNILKIFNSLYKIFFSYFFLKPN